VSDFVVNEWLWSDAFGENEPGGQQRALGVITKLAQSEHRLVVLRGSPFDQKAWACCKASRIGTSQLATAFVRLIRQDLRRCLELDAAHTAQLTPELANSIKADDHYLVRSQLTVAGSILVTTDAPLREIVLAAGLPCLSRDEFLTLL
jgi:hypothetical protein